MPVRRYLNRTDPQLRSAAECQAGRCKKAGLNQTACTSD